MGFDVATERKQKESSAAEQASKLKKETEARRLAQENTEREKRAQEINQSFRSEMQPYPINTSKAGYQVDCQACKLPGGMIPAKIKRFTGLALVSGWIIAFPSIVGIVVAVMVAIIPFAAGYNMFLRLGVALLIFCFSCVTGTAGWLLLSKRSVFLCKRCGYVMDRTTE